MAAPDRLFRLIHALSPAEKGYFRRYAYRDEGRKADALKIFDAMARAGEYDDRAMATRFGHARDRRRWASVKQHVYRLVLRSLVAAQEGKAPTDRFFTLHQEIRALLRHDLREAANDKFRQLDRLVREHDLEMLRPALMDLEVHLGAYHHARADWAAEVVDRNRAVLSGLQRRLEYRSQYARYLQLCLRHGFTLVRTPEAREAFLRLGAEPLLDEVPGPDLGFHAAYSHAMVRLGVPQALGEVSRMLEAGEALLALFDAHPAYRDRYAKYYHQALNNRLNQFLLAGDWAGFDQHVVRIRREAVGVDASADPAERESFLRSRVLHRMLLEGNPDGMRRCVRELEQDPVTFPTQPDQEDILAWHLALARFALADPSAVLDQVQALRSGNRFRGRSLQRWRLHLLYLLVHWRLGDTGAIRSFLDTVLRETRSLEEPLPHGDRVLLDALQAAVSNTGASWSDGSLAVSLDRVFRDHPIERVNDLAQAVRHALARERQT
jgi:tetratricopeptide (TPR) repeat protein